MTALSRRLAEACSIEDLRHLAQSRLPRGVFDFFDGGADDEISLRANREGFERLRLRPRVLVNVQQPDMSTTIVGRQSAVPLVVAPTGAIGAGWPKADVSIARVAALLGIPYTLSTMATSSIEEVAAVGGRLWFQLYVLRDESFANTLLQRADRSGYEALVVTLDLVAGGKRERDLRNRFTVPLRPNAHTIFDFACHPSWCLQMLRHGQPRFKNLAGFEGHQDPRASIAAKVGQSLDASFDWDALKRLRDRWAGKFMVKGVLRGDDAARLAALGVDAIWVSNHGGRQLDGAMSSVDALPDVAAAVKGRVPVLLDSGVRRGTDIVKAVALGAQAVAIGRATLYGAAAGGEAGAERALQILSEELRRAMQLCGTQRVADIDISLLQDRKALPWADQTF
ncbi:L-lactate dehydrogenase (cytochrome)/(S)-mandelate dehydrogenase [Acidovorax sp. 100]|uniref:alpha-hydroxy acid oxidase n=1 Tax=Acidovorax sp. 100 TaxID=2135635 RepID=UPI000EF9D54A|nr:alpha-hydroxy acid oxidase [Acidovorax sp. 100]RMA59954.1 L-lactate dehydrogenase (cytochrome)/(S)-mandelate dehydrogenase [Acidovorax sp. 100]